MNRPATPLLLLTFLISACSSGSSDSAQSSSLSTDPAAAGQLADVQRAINEAAPGDTVQIGPGTFEGRLVIRRSVTLLGAGSDTVLIGLPAIDDAVIEVRGTADVVIADLTVTGPGSGIRIRDSASIAVDNVVARENAGDGIEIRQSSQVSVTDSLLDDNADRGLRIREASFEVLVENCSASGNAGYGMRIRDASTVMIRDSDVSANGESGVRVRDSINVDIVGNDIENNIEYGVRLRSSPLDPEALRQANRVAGNAEGDIRVED